MNADLTFNTIVFKKQWDKEEGPGSSRQSTTRALNEPDTLVIKRQDYVDAKTKVKGKAHTFIVSRVDLDPNSVGINQSFSGTIRIPETAVQADVDVLIATFKAVVADASFIPAVLNGE